jgi:DNA (cytosine-5)-methyltransferase 1
MTLPAPIRSLNLPTHRGEIVVLPERSGSPAEDNHWKTALHNPNSFIVLDLFCGAGGMSLGFEDAGFVVAAGIDTNPSACQTHAANFPGKTLNYDLQAIDDPSSLLQELGIPRIDVIIGGPPCQGFSKAGLSKLRSLELQDTAVRQEIDARNRLYKHFVRFVAELKPLFFVMENVPHLNTYAQGIIARDIQKDFTALGYTVQPVVLNAAHFGVPQSRRRLFFIGSRIGAIWRAPRPAFSDAPRTLRDAIGDLPVVQAPSLIERLPYQPQQATQYQALMRSRVSMEDRDVIYDHIVRPIREDDIEIFKLMQPGGKYRDIPEHYRRYRSDTFDDKYYKLPWDLPGNTITAHMAKDGYRYIHPDQVRTLSVREAARVQSFPDHFRFAGSRSARFIQIGNAVPPILAQAIAESVLRALQRHRQYARGEISAMDFLYHDQPAQLGLPGFGSDPEAIIRNLSACDISS